MTDELQNELRRILEQFPELQKNDVRFNSKNEIELLPNEEYKGEKQLCKHIGNIPDIIKGHSAKIEVRKSQIHGYGVFAKEAIVEGELIEESKLLKLEWRSKYSNDATLNDYTWANQKCECEECKTHGHVRYMALGFGSMYNHSDNPNTKQKLNFKDEVINVWAKSDIQPDEEIFLSYGHKYWIVRDFWAQVNKNKQLEQFHQEQIKPKLDQK